MALPTRYRLSDFDFDLPSELIAQRPADVRSSSRNSQVAHHALVDRSFADLTDLLSPGFVFNDTRVVRSRLFGAQGDGGKVELMLERMLGVDQAWMQCRASHAPRIGMRIHLADDAIATVLERDGRFVRLQFSTALSLSDYLEQHAEVPLPPYITRVADAVDAERYQTIYARHPGAVAAPTAGLHFDQPTLDRLGAHGIEFAYVTLHVGAGTFQPVDVDDLSQHRMHVESFSIPPSAVRAMATAKSRGSKVVAIGTTSLRALESAANVHGALHAGDAETRSSSLLATAFGCRRSPAHQLSSAALDAADACACVCWLSAHPQRVRTRHRRTISILQLRRRHAARSRDRRRQRIAPVCGDKSHVRDKAKIACRYNPVMEFSINARSGAARYGRLKLARGIVETPMFMPVGTYGTVKAMAPNELVDIGAQIILGNTFHLWLRPGVDVIAAHGGLHRFMGWKGPILTDSGARYSARDLYARCRRKVLRLRRRSTATSCS